MPPVFPNANLGIKSSCCWMALGLISRSTCTSGPGSTSPTWADPTGRPRSSPLSWPWPSIIAGAGFRRRTAP